MSHANAFHKTQARTARGGLPLGMAIAIVAAALTTGLLLSLLFGDLGWPYLLCYIVSVLAVTCTVAPRGLYLTVATSPLLFTVFTLLCGWLVTQGRANEGASAFSTTALVTGAFPFLEHFIPFFLTTLASIAIMAFRLWRLRSNARTESEKAQVARRAEAAADKRNRDTSARARERSSRLTVAELIARNEEQKRRAQAANIPLGRTFGQGSEQPAPRGGRVRERDREQRRQEQANQQAYRPNPNRRAGGPGSSLPRYGEATSRPAERSRQYPPKSKAQARRVRPIPSRDDNLYED
ncbi:DUF6542 domain-containing protein [Corynebacterium confusum]|uniref:DUF6542 domain-containing protein n=1 Tax=Corynebacterium confusum TaxID=71254 RepID=UPI0025B4F1FC|nr:DUF6542 domain-containing protein [Corynebacterium confusum]